ncbi:MAG: tetratricopeptide repeat-containing sensor histidine kinase [Bacteroidales bacterium]|nr:tetratricopeptide repeat-containing sensor histidine kinase [Bacteroidales bacterium]
MRMQKGIYLTVLFIYLIILPINIFSQELPHSIKTEIEYLESVDQIKYLGKLCWELREQSMDIAVICGEYACAIADSLGYTKELAQISNYLGVIYLHYDYNSRKAIPYFHAALELGIQIQDTIQIAFAYNNLGDAFYLTRNIPLALEYSKNSLDYFKSVNYAAGIAYSYVNIGLAHRAEKKYKLSCEYFNKAIVIRDSIGDKNGIASATMEIARNYYEKGNLEASLRYFEESLCLHKEIDNKTFIAISLNGIGKVLYKKGEFFEALKKFDEAYKYNLLRNHKNGMIQNHLGRALVYSKTNGIDLGLKELNNALKLSKELGMSSGILDCYQAYTEFYKNAGNLESSIKSFEKYVFVYDSILSIQQSESLDEMQHRLSMSIALNKVNIEYQIKKKETIILLFLTLTLMIVGIAFFYKYKVNKKLNKKLNKINESKDKLFSIISHDLKSPFNSIYGFSELLLKEIEKGKLDRIKRYGDVISQMSKESIKLINNISNWSRSESGLLKLNIEKIDLNDLFDQIYFFYSIPAQKKNVNLSISICSDFYIYADKETIRTIISNLISNAIKFTPEEGEIIVSAYKNGTDVTIEVQDSGIGISKSDLERIFKIKDNYSTLGTNDEKGTGLGLIICKEFTELHDGNIKVESVPGKGSKFIVKIPQNFIK